jgi:hypothetical protein
VATASARTRTALSTFFRHESDLLFIHLIRKISGLR